MPHGELNSTARCWLREARCGNHSWKQLAQVMREPKGTSAPTLGLLGQEQGRQGSAGAGTQQDGARPALAPRPLAAALRAHDESGEEGAGG